jgi:hypothetical protein
VIWNARFAELCEHRLQRRNRNSFLSGNADEFFLKDPTNPFLVETNIDRRIANVAPCCNTMTGVDICRLGCRVEPV